MKNFVILLQSTVNPKCKISFHQNLHQKCLTTNTKQQNLKFEQTKSQHLHYAQLWLRLVLDRHGVI